MPRLFTYTIPFDDGAAPNPFRGMCSLAICKPDIRRVAKKGDWVAGLGSKKAPAGDLSGRLVYAMCVEEVLTLEQYDEQARKRWPHRIPNLTSADLSERLGDCIYKHTNGTMVLRPSVHGPKNRKTDLRGRNALISHDFYYFGCNAVRLPKHLHPICHQTQGHKSASNDPYVDAFVTWVRKQPSGMNGWPNFKVRWNKVTSCGGCVARIQDGKHDRPR